VIVSKEEEERRRGNLVSNAVEEEQLSKVDRRPRKGPESIGKEEEMTRNWAKMRRKLKGTCVRRKMSEISIATHASVKKVVTCSRKMAILSHKIKITTIKKKKNTINEK
jgi:hypothetical protein